MAAPPPHQDGGFFLTWDNLEWVMGATWTAGVVVAGFLWRLSVKVTLLEHVAEQTDAATERRHRENLNAWTELREQIERLASRIDRLWDSKR